ncbi:sugar phosphorylase [Spirochaetota bacterium]
MSNYFSLFTDKGKKLNELLEFIYKDRAEEAKNILSIVISKRIPDLEKLKAACDKPKKGISAKDALLITYGDMISKMPGKADSSGKPEAGRSALNKLSSFLDRYIPGLFSFIHILPFYPYSSDDGFSVMDYRLVDPVLGSWKDISLLGEKRKLVFDFVINHASAKSSWFGSFKRQEKPYNKFFVTRPLDYDYSAVLRPRTHPLITPIQLDNGETLGVWTTFSEDQIDLNFSEPIVLAEFVDIMLFYALKGARMFRLDAIAYLWKMDGTSCAHLPQTHAVVKLLRTILDNLGLDILLLTETNVPHKDNISYFGKADEAHIVYNFSLPPLVLYAFVTADPAPLAAWANQLKVPDNAIMLNFLASHDGIGVTPVQGFIADYGPVLEGVKARGGLISMKASKDGPMPYELNISWADAVAPLNASSEEKAAALLASYGIALAMDGLPAVYFHSLFGSENWAEGPGILAYNRAINRQKPEMSGLECSLKNPLSLRSMALAGFTNLLKERSRRNIFDPGKAAVKFWADKHIFYAERARESQFILILVNCSNLPLKALIPEQYKNSPVFNPVTAKLCGMLQNNFIELAPFALLWLEKLIH